MVNKKVPKQKEPGVQADRHWREVMDAARAHGFIAQSYGGTALLLTHRVQLEEYGERGYLRIQKMNGRCAKELGYSGCLSDDGWLSDCAYCALARPKRQAETAAQREGDTAWVK